MSIYRNDYYGMLVLAFRGTIWTGPQGFGNLLADLGMWAFGGLPPQTYFACDAVNAYLKAGSKLASTAGLQAVRAVVLMLVLRGVFRSGQALAY
jgi:hypothetical protein